jgi:hypothetical protein
MFPQQSPDRAEPDHKSYSGTLMWAVIVVGLAAVPLFLPPDFDEVSRNYRRELLEVGELVLFVVGFGTLIYLALRGSVMK